MALHPVGLVGDIFVEIVGAVFLRDGVEQIERRVVVVRIAGDHLAAELGLEEIERRFRRVFRLHVLGVVGIGERADVPDDERAVGILERLVDGVEALRLEGEHLALSLPAHEILRGLEQHHVGCELSILELLLDPLIEHVAEAAFDRHREAGKLAFEFARQRLVVRHRAAGIDRERFFVLGLGVELVDASRLGRDHRTGERRQQDRLAVHDVTGGAIMFASLRQAVLAVSHARGQPLPLPY